MVPNNGFILFKAQYVVALKVGKLQLQYKLNC